MRRHNKLSKFISSIRTHVHRGNTEKLENKNDTEKNVERILQLITAEESDTVSFNSVNKSELTSLIKDIHKGYQALYGCYDELTEKLKKKFRQKEDNGNFSVNSTSDSSDSSDSPDSESELSTKNSGKNHEGEAKADISLEHYTNLQEQLEGAIRRNHELEAEAASMVAKITNLEGVDVLGETEDMNRILENQIHIMQENIKTLQSENRDLEQKLEASVKQHHELNQSICTMHEQIEILISEKMEALSKLQESEKYIEEHISEISHLKDKIMTMESDNMSLKQESEKQAQELAYLNQKIDDIDKEKEAILSENFELVSKIKGTEKALADQRDEANLNLKSATDDLSSKITQLLSGNEMLKLELEAANRNGHELTSRLRDAQEENGALNSEIDDLKTKSELLNNENTRLLNAIHVSNKQLKDKEAENSDLASRLKEAMQLAEEGQQKVELLSLEIEEVKRKSSQAYEVLEMELQAKEQEETKLKQILEATSDEKLVLISENEELSAKAKLFEGEITDLKSQRDQLEIEKSELRVRVENLDAELEATKVQLINAENKLEAAGQQIEKLTMENSELFSKSEIEGIQIKDLQHLLEHLKEENSTLNENKRLLQESEKIIEDLTVQIEQLKTDNGQLQNQVNDSSHEVELANHKLSELTKQIGVLEEEICTLISKLEQAEASIRKQADKLEAFTEENSTLLQKNMDMHERNSDLDSKLEDQMKAVRDGCLEILNLANNFDDEVTQKVTVQERLLLFLKSSLNDLHEECKQLKYRFHESCQKLEVAEAVGEERMKEINKLVESVKELQVNHNVSEAERAVIIKEVAGLKGQLETQSCLFKQNLKITETEYREKEAKHMKMIAELQCNVKKLENETRIMSAELTGTIEAVGSGVSDFCQGLDELESEFKQKHCGIERQLAWITVDAEIMKTRLRQKLYEKQEMNEKLRDMAVRLKESEEGMAALKHKAEGLRDRLGEKEKEMEKVSWRSIETDRRLEELETAVREKEEEIVARNKEKLEAIKQLSQMIDYQHEKYNQLGEYLVRLKPSNNRRRL
ncbi:unnamed protein product [Musa acuminata subsp. malaccensis]|uniref:(wild Malaysian banana) hypothetical protein n=1 Tax=Musa acuminata subsp. malaccensis TaxID=214687 RepID=A0A804JZZ9_MUSAM|nr:PREDICTED: paramyosin [Musa acuminata subsp. malaccensis]XP_009410856.1 PREDICTED: paramyosin [Musa acuminata subsp. malaccensis]CAG1857796.1 unnamed protein product [Musa acuminata subsp. malaccensis]